jgi:anti-sigma regulatory factor (Ser/Thr protein kinase)
MTLDTDGSSAGRPAPRRQAGIDVPADTLAARAARRFVTECLAEWATPERVRPDVVLAASELVTNAVEHGGGPISVQLAGYPDRLRLRVRDTSPRLPVRREATLLSERSRGLNIVAQLAAAIGHEPAVVGKWVWADFPVADRELATSGANGDCGD